MHLVACKLASRKPVPASYTSVSFALLLQPLDALFAVGIFSILPFLLMKVFLASHTHAGSTTKSLRCMFVLHSLPVDLFSTELP